MRPDDMIDPSPESADDLEAMRDVAQGANEERAFGAFDCGFCGNPATGLASIGDRRYCHGDDDTEPTCYEKAQWEMSGVRPDLTLLQNERRYEEESA